MKFLVRLCRELPNKRSKAVLGFPGGSVERPVVLSNITWFANDTLKDAATLQNRNALGIGIPSSFRSDGMTVEANVSLKGLSRRLAGLFARNDGTGNTVLPHCGWSKGVRRTALPEWHREALHFGT